ANSLGKTLAPFGSVDMLQDDASAAVWRAVRDIEPFAANGALGAWPVWRIVCPPASGGALGERLSRDTGGDGIYDWGGGLIWAALPPRPDAHAAMVRQHVNAVGGHAMLLRAPEEIRRKIEVFHPQPAGLAALSERVRHSFDPKGILNRGRMTREPATLKPNSALPNSPTPISLKPTRFCAPACIAASVPRPVLPTCCSATNSIARAAGSISSRRCWKRTGRPRKKWSSTLPVVSPASPAC